MIFIRQQSQMKNQVHENPLIFLYETVVLHYNQPLTNDKIL